MGANPLPNVLLVNASSDLRNALEDQLRLAFGSQAQPSVYCRPDSNAHPRMRPVDRPQFNLIFVDCAPWIAGQTDLAILSQWTIPNWLIDDVARRVSNALCILLIPSERQSAVEARDKELAAQLRHSVCVFGRELVKDEGFHVKVLEAWAEISMGQSWKDRLRGLVDPER